MQKVPFLIKVPAIFIFFIFSFGSCIKENSTKNKVSIAGFLAGNDNLSLMTAAIAHAGLKDMFDANTGSYTLFAPTDEAFSSVGLGSVGAINSFDSATLAGILLYHTINKAMLFKDLPTGPNAGNKTEQGDSVYITANTKGYYVNGIQLLSGNAVATNGVVHVIAKLLSPPIGTIISSLEINPNLSFLVAALQRTSAGSSNLFTLLQSSGPNTLFAPTNQAFIDEGFADIDAINAADPDALALILKNHILSYRNFSSDFSDGYTAATLNRGSLTINTKDEGYTVRGSGDSTPFNITSFDIDADNGVVHIIDGVLHLF